MRCHLVDNAQFRHGVQPLSPFFSSISFTKTPRGKGSCTRGFINPERLWRGSELPPPLSGFIEPLELTPRTPSGFAVGARPLKIQGVEGSFFLSVYINLINQYCRIITDKKWMFLAKFIVESRWQSAQNFLYNLIIKFGQSKNNFGI